MKLKENAYFRVDASLTACGFFASLNSTKFVVLGSPAELEKKNVYIECSTPERKFPP